MQRGLMKNILLHRRRSLHVADHTTADVVYTVTCYRPPLVLTSTSLHSQIFNRVVRAAVFSLIPASPCYAIAENIWRSHAGVDLHINCVAGNEGAEKPHDTGTNRRRRFVGSRYVRRQTSRLAGFNALKGSSR